MLRDLESVKILIVLLAGPILLSRCKPNLRPASSARKLDPALWNRVSAVERVVPELSFRMAATLPMSFSALKLPSVQRESSAFGTSFDSSCKVKA